MFIDEYCGAVAGGYNDGADDFVGTWRTFNGGWDWEFHYNANDALAGAIEYQVGNAIWICDYNHFFTVGEVSGTTGVIVELSPLGSV